MDYKKLQELKDRLDEANSAIASVFAHVTMMIEAAQYVGVFEQALGQLGVSIGQKVRNPLHKLEVDLYELIGENAPDVTVQNVSGETLKLFGTDSVKPREYYTMKWNARYSGGPRRLIEEGKLQEVPE